MTSLPRESPRRTVYDCIMRALICFEDIGAHDGTDMIEIYEGRIKALMRSSAPHRTDVPVKLGAVIVQLNNLSRLLRKEGY